MKKGITSKTYLVTIDNKIIHKTNDFKEASKKLMENITPTSRTASILNTKRYTEYLLGDDTVKEK